MPLPSPTPANYKLVALFIAHNATFVTFLNKETETNQTITSLVWLLYMCFTFWHFFLGRIKLSSADEFAAEFDAPRHDVVVFNVTPLN